MALKIFFYIHSLTGGGAERVTASLVRHLADKDHDVGVITMHSEERDFYPLDLRVRRITLNLAGATRGIGKLTVNYRRWLELRSVFKTEKPDVVVAMMTTSIVLAILAAIGLPVRVYGSERNYPGLKATTRPWALLRRLFYRFADGHVAQTREAESWLQHHTAARNVHVIPNPVFWPIPSFSPQVAPDNVVPPERKIILAVGTKPDQKGFDLLVRAFSGLASDHPNWALVIIGLDPASDAISGGGASVQWLAEEVGVAQSVYLPGRLGNVAEWYQRADLFVLSSRYEGFPNVLLEAMASGCACIAFDCNTGPRDLIQHGVNGLLVSAECVDALTNAMARLMSNDDLRVELGNNAVAVRQTFSERRVMALWQQVFQ